MWTILDEKAMKRFQLQYDELGTPSGILSLVVGAMEHLASLILNNSLDNEDPETIHVVDRKPFAPSGGRRGRWGFRPTLCNALRDLTPLLVSHYPHILKAIYVITPCQEMMASLSIPDDILLNMVILDDRKALENYLGPHVPAEYGGSGRALGAGDYLKRDALDMHNPKGTPKWSDVVNLRDEVNETEIREQPAPNQSGPRLIYSETIGLPNIILDPEDLNVAEDLCPGKMGARLVWVDSDMVVKFGYGVRFAEAEALHLV